MGDRPPGFPFPRAGSGNSGAGGSRRRPVGSGETTTTELELGNFNYVPGDCVTWDQTEVGMASTNRVPCGQSHLVEVVSGTFEVTGFGSSFPGLTALAPYYQQRCTAPAEKFLGYNLDPQGRFGAGAVGPSPDDWGQGDRVAWCVLQLRSNSSNLPAFTGEIRGASQELLYPTGTCGTTTAAPVPCAGTHSWQVSGNVNLAGVSTYPGTDQAWQSLVDPKCGSISLAFVGGSYPAGVESSALNLSATSWADGERTAQCTVSKYPPTGGAALSMKGSLAKAG